MSKHVSGVMEPRITRLRSLVIKQCRPRRGRVPVQGQHVACFSEREQHEYGGVEPRHSCITTNKDTESEINQLECHKE